MLSVKAGFRPEVEGATRTRVLEKLRRRFHAAHPLDAARAFEQALGGAERVGRWSG